MLSLESDLRPRRVEVDSLGSEKAQQDYQKVNELEQTFLRVEPYRRRAEYEYRSTRNQRVIADLQGLQSYVQDCEQEAELYRIATMDCEGKDGNFPEVLLAQFLGAHRTPPFFRMQRMAKCPLTCGCSAGPCSSR